MSELKGCTKCGCLKPHSEYHKHPKGRDGSTGAVRGLLCSNCNTAIGKFKDDPNLMAAAAAYVTAARTSTLPSNPISRANAQKVSNHHG